MVFRLFYFSACYPAKAEVSYDTTEGGIGLEKDSALYQLMLVRMNGIIQFPRGLRGLSLRATQSGLRKPLPQKHIYLYITRLSAKDTNAS